MHWNWLILGLIFAPGLPPGNESAPTSSFAREGVAFLNKHCIACHGPDKKKGDVVLHTFKDDASLLKDRKTWNNVLRVISMGEMPPQGRPQPSITELETFTKSVNVVFDHADRTGKRDPGHVTVRRLNRFEYNNTIRDLVGVDFQPAEDFPSDDVGNGFDNIGDVLSMSPILLERYLTAAEAIVQRAIVAKPAPPEKRWMASRYLEPAINQDIKWRSLTREALFTPYKLSLAGDYVFSFRAWGRPESNESPRVAILHNGKEIMQLEIKAQEKNPLVYEVPFRGVKGTNRLAVKLLNPTPVAPKPEATKSTPNKDKSPDKNGKDGKEASSTDNKPKPKESVGDSTSRAVTVEWFLATGPADNVPETHRRLLASQPGKSHLEKTREVLNRFVTRAYRRPATPEEIDRLVALVEKAEEEGERWEAGIQVALQAVLVSPKFLFRVELDNRPDSDDPHPINDYQLASRLSYFLWATMPDQELFDLAEKGQLSANLDAQVSRMLKDPRSRTIVDQFAMQWLHLRNLKNFSPDTKLFPSFNETLRSAMLKETELFFQAILQENRSIIDLIDADFTFLNEPLARHYGIADTKGNWSNQKPTKPAGQPIRGNEFKRVELQSRDRGGVITQASVLAVTSNPTRTSPVKRGRWVLEQILGTPPPPPPPNVPELKEQGPLTGTLRQQMEQHRANPSCAGCHARMDPIGFAFENFNAIGAFRTQDGSAPIDPSGVLPSGQTFQGPADLKNILKDKKELFSRCLTEKMLTYALGRGVDYYDKPAIEKIMAAVSADQYRIGTLITEIVKSEPFRLRRGKSQEGSGP